MAIASLRLNARNTVGNVKSFKIGYHTSMSNARFSDWRRCSDEICNLQLPNPLKRLSAKQQKHGSKVHSDRNYFDCVFIQVSTGDILAWC